MRSPRGQSGRREGDNENNHVIVIPSLRRRSGPRTAPRTNPSSPRVRSGPVRQHELQGSTDPLQDRSGRFGLPRACARRQGLPVGRLTCASSRFLAEPTESLPTPARFRPDAPYRIGPPASRHRRPEGPAAVAYNLLRTTKGSGEARGSRDSMAGEGSPIRGPCVGGRTSDNCFGVYPTMPRTHAGGEAEGGLFGDSYVCPSSPRVRSGHFRIRGSHQSLAAIPARAKRPLEAT
jgi:hypothetical protein